jgi:polysaccharide biosynthesis/export protein
MRRCMQASLKVLLLLAACAAVLGAQAPPPVSEAAQQAGKAHDDKYLIGVDDVLAINVWREPDISRSIPVRSDGKISLPLVGELQAAGRTPVQLEQDITAKLRSFMNDPQVTVIVQQSNSEKINVLGQVVKPGTYAYTVAPTVVDALAAAGGLRDFAKKKAIVILREKPGGGQDRMTFNYADFLKGKNGTKNVDLQPHDTVVVP